MSRHLLQETVECLAAMAAPPTAYVSGGGGVGVHTDTLLILAAVLCFLLSVVGLALVARCSRLCNPSAYFFDAMPPKTPCKGIKKKALQSLPTMSWAPEQREKDEEEGEAPECAICLIEFARGDEVHVLPTCGHGFHAACFNVRLLSSSTCPSCRRTLVFASPPLTKPPTTCSSCAAAVADRRRRGAGLGHWTLPVVAGTVVAGGRVRAPGHL